MRMPPEIHGPAVDVEQDDVTPEAVAVMRERARPSLEGRTFRKISGDGSRMAISEAAGFRFDVV